MTKRIEPRRARSVVLVIAGLLASLMLAAPAAAQKTTDPATQYVELLLSRYSGTTPTPGCAVAVRRDGVIVYAAGHGYASLEHDIPITSKSVFYLASLSKQFTAMSVVLLSQQGKLSLDDDIRKYVPEVPNLGSTITLRHLLWHTSGMRDYFSLLGILGWASDEPLSETQLLDLIARQKGLNFQPGERFLYSNTGYALLGVVVKRVSKMSLRDFAAKEIFQPLGMTNTQYRDDHRSLIRNRAMAYMQTAAGYQLSLPELDVVGDGGMFSTVEDLMKWDANFDTGKVGGREGVAMLQRSGTLNSGATTGYGLGLTLGPLGVSLTQAASGAYGGYSSSFVRVPDFRLSVAALCNIASAPSKLADQIATVYLPTTVGTGPLPGISLPNLIIPAGSPGRVEPDKPANAPDPSELPWLEGRYYSDELNMHVTLLSRDNALIMERPRGEKIKFERVTAVPGLYMSADQITIRVTREKGEKGAVKGFTLGFGRVTELKFVRQPF
jgi:CubicO group peptidase (beta-lactamase class C family)